MNKTKAWERKKEVLARKMKAILFWRKFIDKNTYNYFENIIRIIHNLNWIPVCCANCCSIPLYCLRPGGKTIIFPYKPLFINGKPPHQQTSIKTTLNFNYGNVFPQFCRTFPLNVLHFLQFFFFAKAHRTHTYTHKTWKSEWAKTTMMQNQRFTN